MGNNFKNLTIVLLLVSLLFANFLIIKAQEVPEIPSDVRGIIPEKDLLEVFCLMTKWKSGEFFASMDALGEVLSPALQELQGIGMSAEMPDIASYKSRGQVKVDAICQASSWEAAQSAVQDFMSFGESVRQDLQGTNSSLGQGLKAKGEELRSRIHGEIDVWVEQEKTQMEEELKTEASSMAESLKIKLENEVQNMQFTSGAEAMAYANSHAQGIKAEVENWVSGRVEVKKAELESKINSKISEIVGMDAEKFKEIGESIGNIEEIIKERAEANLSEYEKYKIQAMAKRKEIITAVLGKKIAAAANLIKEKESLLAEARLNDPTVKTADDYILELQADKEALADKIQLAVDNNDEAALNTAIADMQNKWLGVRSKLEADLAKRQSPAEICSQVMPQISQAKPQVVNGLKQIQLAQEEIDLKKQECELTDKAICEKVDAIYSQMSLAKEKTQTLLNQISQAETKCASVTETTTFDEEFLNLMIDLRNNGPQWQKEIVSLKNQWLADKKDLEKELAKKPDVKTICSLKELSNGKIDVQRKLNDLKERLDRCDKPCVGEPQACSAQATTCGLYRARNAKFDSAIQKGEVILAKFTVISQKCVDPTSVSLTEIISLAKEAKQLGKDFLDLRQEAID